MSSLAKKLKTLAALAGFVAAGVATGAQAQTTQCGVTGTPTNPGTITYDPFQPTGIQEATVSLFLKRENYSGGGDTRIVNFYLKEVSNRADGTKIVPISVTGAVSVEGLGLNIFYGSADGVPTLLPITVLPSSSNRFLKIDFTGNNAGSDTATVNFKVTLPPLANLEATQQLAFDAIFSCNIQGGRANGYVEPNGRIPNAVVFPVTVLSALRASFQGQALDFGEIGQVTNDQASTKTLTGRSVRVESSGVYTVTMTSANTYKLKKLGAATAMDEVRYKVRFLGQTRGDGDTSTLTQRCKRAEIGPSLAKYLPIVPTLVEGGAGKNPSPNYSDYLTVTLTPEAYETVESTDCAGLS